MGKVGAPPPQENSTHQEELTEGQFCHMCPLKILICPFKYFAQASALFLNEESVATL